MPLPGSWKTATGSPNHLFIYVVTYFGCIPCQKKTKPAVNSDIKVVVFLVCIELA